MPFNLTDLVQILCPLMAGFDAPWGVAGGWAVDLFLGRETRSHADVEIAIFRDDQRRIHDHFRDWSFDKIVNGSQEGWHPGERLSLPVHEIHGRSNSDPSVNLEPRSLEVLLNERDDRHWIFRRNAEVKLDVDSTFIQTPFGLPVLSPEIVLLFKSKSPRAKDQADFENALPVLDAAQRRWMYSSLALCHPGHPWLVQLHD